MGEMAEFYRDWDNHVRARKMARLEQAEEMERTNPVGWEKRTPIHWQFVQDDRIVMDYWPTTGRYRIANQRTRMSSPEGVLNALAKIINS